MKKVWILIVIIFIFFNFRVNAKNLYSRNISVWYAKRYAKKYNNKYKKYKGKDCANFVSQVLRAGGKKLTKKWRPGRLGWVNSNSLYKLFKKGKIRSKRIYNKKNIKIGDILMFKNSIRVYHVAIVTKVKKTRKIVKIYFSGHSKNVRNALLKKWHERNGHRILIYRPYWWLINKNKKLKQYLCFSLFF